jgi:hypothetical protein
VAEGRHETVTQRDWVGVYKDQGAPNVPLIARISGRQNKQFLASPVALSE